MLKIYCIDSLTIILNNLTEICCGVIATKVLRQKKLL